jgi:hypothetical protein
MPSKLEVSVHIGCRLHDARWHGDLPRLWVTRPPLVASPGRAVVLQSILADATVLRREVRFRSGANLDLSAGLATTRFLRDRQLAGMGGSHDPAEL